MRGAALFLATIVLVVPSGRTALEEYAAISMTRFNEQSPGSEIILGLCILVALLLLVILREGKAEPPRVYFWWETRGHEATDEERAKRRGSRRPAAGWRLDPGWAGASAPSRSFFKRLLHACVDAVSNSRIAEKWRARWDKVVFWRKGLPSRIALLASAGKNSAWR